MSTGLVTGATAGIGHRFAAQLAARRHDLVLVARDRERLETAAELWTSYAVEVEVLSADLADRDQLATVESRLADRDRPVDLLVNIAGFGLKQWFLDNDVEAEQAMLDVLVTAVLRLTHAALGPMTERGQGVTVMELCPGFTKTGFHERMEVLRGPGFMWLDADFLVRTALADLDKGRVFSIPGAQYKTIVGVARLVPTRVLQRLQSIGPR